MTAPTAGLVQVKVFVRFSVVLVRFMRVRTRLPWVFDEITTPVEKQFGPSPMDGKTERAADPLRENALALLLGDVEEGKVLGAELARGEVSEVADLRRDLAECADGEAGHAPRVVRVHLCLDRPGGVCGRAELRVKLLGCLVVVLMHLVCALLDGRPESVDGDSE